MCRNAKNCNSCFFPGCGTKQSILQRRCRLIGLKLLPSRWVRNRLEARRQTKVGYRGNQNATRYYFTFGSTSISKSVQPISNPKSVPSLLPSVLSAFWECGAKRVKHCVETVRETKHTLCCIWGKKKLGLGLLKRRAFVGSPTKTRSTTTGPSYDIIVSRCSRDPPIRRPE